MDQLFVAPVRRLCVLPLLTMAWANASALEIQINHKTRAQSLSGLAEVARGETVTITVEETNNGCFSYNAKQLRDPTSGNKAAGGGPLPVSPVVIKTTHQRAVTQYEVKIDKITTSAKDSAECKEIYKSHAEGTWQVPVTTVGWNAEFSGGLVVDGLTDRKYSLQPGTGGNFTVTRDRGSEDRTNQRLGLFVHLVDTRNARNKDITWVPVTVGIGFDDKARYMLGTGYKFGDQWFLTAGVVTGKRASLPVGVSEGMSTTNQNLLSTMGSRSSTSWFISFTFNFLGDTSRSSIQGLFPAPKGEDQPGAK